MTFFPQKCQDFKELVKTKSYKLYYLSLPTQKRFLRFANFCDKRLKLAIFSCSYFWHLVTFFDERWHFAFWQNYFDILFFILFFDVLCHPLYEVSEIKWQILEPKYFSFLSIKRSQLYYFIFVVGKKERCK